MANRWQYPRWRRVTMQVAMWGVFAASLGMAALLSNRPMQRATMYDDAAWPIAPPLLPYGWVQVPPGDGDDATLALRAVERTGERGARTLMVRVLPIDGDVTPLQLLASQELPVDLDQGSDAIDPDDRTPMAIEMVGQQGLITGGQLVGQVGGQRITAQAYFAVAVVPRQFAVLASLQSLGPAQADDVDILRRVATSIDRRRLIEGRHLDVKPAPPTSTDAPADAPGEVTLPGGARLAVPAGYTALPATDPQETKRSLAKGSATVLDLVPCVALDSDADDDRVAMVALHDPAYHGGSVRPLHQRAIVGLRQWLFVPRAGAAPAATTAAYLVTDASGAGVLALFRGTVASASAYDVAWQSLVASLRFGAPRDLAPLLTAGDRAVERVRVQQRTALPATSELWWLWFRDGNDPLVGWSSLAPAEAPRARGGVGRSVWREAGTVRGCDDRWEHDANLTAYSRQSIADPAATVGTAPGSPKHYLRLAGGQLMFGAGGPGGMVSRAPRQAPKNFLPGPVLEASLASLGDQPLLLRTDRFPGAEPCVHTGLLTLLIEPVAAREQADGLDALRSLSVTVNGSGERSRWYLNPDGTVAQVDFRGGLHRKPSTETEIESSFGTDPRMRP